GCTAPRPDRGPRGPARGPSARPRASRPAAGPPRHRTMDGRLRAAARRASDRCGPGPRRGPARRGPRARPRRRLHGPGHLPASCLPVAQLRRDASVAPPRRAAPCTPHPPEGELLSTPPDPSPRPEPTVTTGTSPASPVAGRVHRHLETPLGTYVLAADGDDLVGVWREAQKKFPAPARLGEPAAGTHTVLDEAGQQLLDY